MTKRPLFAKGERAKLKTFARTTNDIDAEIWARIVSLAKEQRRTQRAQLEIILELGLKSWDEQNEAPARG